MAIFLNGFFTKDTESTKRGWDFELGVTKDEGALRKFGAFLATRLADARGSEGLGLSCASFWRAGFGAFGATARGAGRPHYDYFFALGRKGLGSGGALRIFLGRRDAGGPTFRPAGAPAVGLFGR